MGGSCLASWNDGGHQAVWISFQSPLRVRHAGKHREKGTRGGSKIEGSAVRGGSSLHLVSQLGKPEFVLLHNFFCGEWGPGLAEESLIANDEGPWCVSIFLVALPFGSGKPSILNLQGAPGTPGSRK